MVTTLTAHLADHPALAFLNTHPGLRTDSPTELIPDGKALLDWLLLAGLVDPAELARIRRRFSATELDALAAQARALRESLRPVVEKWTRKRAVPPPQVLERLNRLLAAAPEVRSLEIVDGRLVDARSVRLETVESLLSPIADAFARLFADGDPTMVRECGAHDCSLWFYDRTKSHQRRWCSMASCGTRAKVATYRARQRGER